jgi:hypothetical protein
MQNKQNGGAMNRQILLLALLLGLVAFATPALRADDNDWKTVKTKVELLPDKGDVTSPFFRPAPVGGDKLNLPVEGGSMTIVVSAQKVMVDNTGSGKADFLAAQGDRSTPFQVTLVYGNGDKVKHTYAIFKNGSNWALKRVSGISVNMEGTKIILSDENNNGNFCETGGDAIFVGSSPWGIPLSSVVIAGGKLYEIKYNESGTEMSYRLYTGKTGKVDICKEWTGKSDPKSAIFKGSCDAGTVFIDVAGKEVSVPVGSYGLMAAYLPDVTITGGNTSFQASEENVATMKWGPKLSVSASLSVDPSGKKWTLSPVPTVRGVSGESYAGAFMEEGKFAFKVVMASANGAPIGREQPWSMCAS